MGCGTELQAVWQSRPAQVALTVATFALTSACGPEMSLDQLEISGGAASSCYPQTVRVLSETGTCTGVAIGRDTVLFAAHCVVLGGQAPGGQTELVSGIQGLGRPTAVYVHPGYQQCRPAGETFAATSSTDLAVVKLDRPILADDTEPATLASELPTVGASLDVVGYGRTGPEPSQHDFERRIGRFRFDGANPDSSLNITGLDVGVCGGDSGGAAYRQGSPCNHPPPPAIVGIVSSQPLGVPQGQCANQTTSVLANPAEESNRRFIESALDGTATPFLSQSQIPACCLPGQTRDCPGPGVQTCLDSHEWGPCNPSGGGGEPPPDPPWGGCTPTEIQCSPYGGCYSNDGYLYWDNCGNSWCSPYGC